jgi:hypothetical protein
LPFSGFLASLRSRLISYLFTEEKAMHDKIKEAAAAQAATPDVSKQQEASVTPAMTEATAPAPSAADGNLSIIKPFASSEANDDLEAAAYMRMQAEIDVMQPVVLPRQGHGVDGDNSKVFLAREQRDNLARTLDVFAATRRFSGAINDQVTSCSPKCSGKIEENRATPQAEAQVVTQPETGDVQQ